jgi:hypothetical protein
MIKDKKSFRNYGYFKINCSSGKENEFDQFAAFSAQLNAKSQFGNC